MVFKIKDNNGVSYEIEILGKYTLIIGDSGTGKTYFTDLVSALKDNVVTLQSPLKVHLIPAEAEPSILQKFHNTVLIMDEFCELLRHPEIGRLVKKSENYFVIISRQIFSWLPVSVDSVYVLKNSGKHHKAVPLCNRMLPDDIGEVDLVLTEDKRSSFLFFQKFFPNILAEPANGKENIASKLLEILNTGKFKNILVVYDSAAFGTNLSALLSVLAKKGSTIVKILDWESYEWYLLNSHLFDRDKKGKLYPITLEKSGCKFESLEQMCTDIISHKISYSKEKLPNCMHSKRDCSRCSNNDVCNYKTNKSSEELFVYDPITTIKSASELNPGTSDLNLF